MQVVALVIKVGPSAADYNTSYGGEALMNIYIMEHHFCDRIIMLAVNYAELDKNWPPLLEHILYPNNRACKIGGSLVIQFDRNQSTADLSKILESPTDHLKKIDPIFYKLKS